MHVLRGTDFRQGCRADEYGLLVCGHPVPAVGAFHLVSVEGDDFHQGAEAQLFFQQEGGGMQHGEGKGRVKEHFRRVIAGLAVDVHAAGEVRGLGVVRPVVVGKPSVRGRHGGEVRKALAGGRVQAGKVRLPDFLHAGG